MSPAPERPNRHPAPRADGRLSVTITHLELAPADWTRIGRAPTLDIAVRHEQRASVAFYRDIYHRVGRPWLWYERRLLSDGALANLLASRRHELHVAREADALVGFFELNGEEIAFFGLTMDYIGQRIGPWLLDLAIARLISLGNRKVRLNTNTLDHPRALATYRNAGFRVSGRERRELQDPRVLWPDLYLWPPP